MIVLTHIHQTKIQFIVSFAYLRYAHFELIVYRLYFLMRVNAKAENI